MNKAHEEDHSFIRLRDRLPKAYEAVIVVCRDCRRYGYLDKDGIWRSHYTHEELKDVIGWAP